MIQFTALSVHLTVNHELAVLTGPVLVLAAALPRRRGGPRP